MASDLTTSTTILSALGFMHPVLRDVDDALWTEECSYVEDAPIPGTAELQTATSGFALDVLGSQTSGGVLHVRCQAPRSGAIGVAMKESGDARYMGHDPAHVISGFEAIDWTDGTGSGDYTIATHNPQIRRLDKNHLVGVIYHLQTSVLISNHRVSFSYRTVASSTWTTVDIYTQAGAPPNSQTFNPCFVELDSGELLAWHWVFDSDADEAQIIQWVSRDQGVTWIQASPGCLPTAIDVHSTTGFTVGRLRAGVNPNGDVLLIVEATANSGSNIHNLWQYASTNFGGRFSLVDEANTTAANGETGIRPDIIVEPTSGAFSVLYVQGSTNDGCIRTIGGAFQPLFDTTAVNLLGTNSVWGTAGTAGEMAAWRDDDGTYYAAGLAKGGTALYGNAGMLVRSNDQGRTWTALSSSGLTVGGAGVGIWYRIDDSASISTTFLRDFSACGWGGTVMLAHNWTSATANEGDSLAVVHLGGWTTETMPGLSLFADPAKRVGFTNTWIPHDLPGDVGWTQTTSGTATETLENGFLKIVTGAPGVMTYDRAMDGTSGQTIQRVHVVVVNGGSLIADEVYLRVRVSSVDISIRFEDSGFAIWDNNGSPTQIGSDIAISGMASTGVEILFGLSHIATAFSLAYRAGGEGITQKFLVGYDDQTMNTAAASAKTIIWGHDTAAAATSRWTFYGYSDGAYVGVGMSTPIDSPAELFPRDLSDQRSYLTDGVEVRDAGSQAFSGDLVYITASSSYSVRHLWPRQALTLRRKFQTADDASEIKIAFRFDPSQVAAANTDPVHNIGRDAIMFAALGINWRTGYVEGWNPAGGGGAGSWDTLHTIDAAEGISGLKWKRNGLAVSPSVASAHIGTPPYLLGDEFVGATFELASGVVREITSNTAGLWRGASGGQDEEPPVLALTGLTGSEGANGLTGRIWSRQVAVVVSLRGTQYTGYRLRVPAQTTASGKFEIGAVLLSALHGLGQRPSWGRRIESSVPVDRVVLSDGTVSSRVLAPVGTVVELPFTAMMHTAQVDELAPSPDFLKADTDAAALAITSVKATPYQLQSLLSQTHDVGYPATPVCFLYRMPVFTTGSSGQFNRSWDMIYGEASTRIRLEQVQGEERATVTGKSGEVWRIPLLSIRRLI